MTTARSKRRSPVDGQVVCDRRSGSKAIWWLTRPCTPAGSRRTCSPTCHWRSTARAPCTSRGSGIAGPLRAWWRDADPSLVESVWGRVESEPGPDAGWASILIIHDAPLITDDFDLEVAQHVGHRSLHGDCCRKSEVRPRACARAGALSVVARNCSDRRVTTVPKHKMDDRRWERVQSLLRGMLEDLASGVIRFGADKSRRLGKLRLEKAGIEHRDLANGILDTLKNRASPQGINQFFPECIEAVRSQDPPVDSDA